MKKKNFRKKNNNIADVKFIVFVALEINGNVAVEDERRGWKGRRRGEG